MAKRPIFIPNLKGEVGITVRILEFDWYPGFAKIQKQRSITSLHKAAKDMGWAPLLEVSTNSNESLGADLSAFNLKFTTKKYQKEFSVESAFQGSKVFHRAGPHKELYFSSPRDAKKFITSSDFGGLVGFEFFNIHFPLEPKTFFYDWLYINALLQNLELLDLAEKFVGFSDIAFNPQKSINCQAKSLALAISLNNRGLLKPELCEPMKFLDASGGYYSQQENWLQNSLF
ncbi:hypothetical protein PUV54_14245 [Hyphococcus flavus]|uniref:Uncharacterized protein n=1 Tax=Hyphococcus flavus TaxID=1866326 RepID=A0AAE9ZEF9_9PROT|nr:hypothetical protein [Hyphococcus flavus]WDI31112.1 hypothetical protein PUV54_14245 [Hyphococcus flavus]